MQDAVQSLLSNVERFLRWVYPGLLFLALLHLGSKDGVIETSGLDVRSPSLQIFGLTTWAIVAGFVIYSLQRYVVHEMFVQYLVFWVAIRKGDAYSYALKKKCVDTPIRRFPSHFWQWSACLQWDSLQAMQGYSGWRDYSWAVTHALGLSSWLILLGRLLAQEGSTLSKANWWVVGIGVILAGMWLWQELRNILPPIWADPPRKEPRTGAGSS